MGGDVVTSLPLAEPGRDFEDLSTLFLENRTRVPRPGQSHIERPALAGRIMEAARRKKVILISAPAGYSKTATLAKIARAESNSTRFFWVSLGEEDNLSTLLSMAYLALDPADVPWKLSRIALTKLATSSETGPLLVADIFADALSSTDVPRGAIVLDDLHNVSDPAVFKALDRLVERLPQNWTLILAARRAPPMSLVRMQLRGELAEFRSNDLAFTQDEFRALAVSRLQDLSEDSIHAIWEKLSGWPAACELALQVGVGRSALAASGSAIFELLSRDVLAKLPASLQTFLMCSSVLPELTEDLCSAVTRDGEVLKQMRDIRALGLFVSELAEEPLTLKLHDLFADFLRLRLKEEYASSEIRELYRRAANAETNPERRIGFLLKAGDLDEAEQAFATVAYSLFLEGDREGVFNLVSYFPADHVEASAEIAFILGLCESADSNWIATQRHMERAARLYMGMHLIERSQRARAHEIIAYIGLAMVPHATELLKALTQETLDTLTHALCAFASYWLSRVGGPVEVEMQSFDCMLELLLKSNDPVTWNECALHIYLGGQRGMRARAERYATAVLAIAGNDHFSLRDSAMSMRACHHLLIGDYGKAAEMTREIEQNQSWNGKPHSVRTFVYIAKSLIAFLEGNIRELRDNGAKHLAEFEGREGVSWAYWRGTTLIFLGKLHAALEDWDALKAAREKLADELHILDMPYLRQGKAFLDILWQLHEGKSEFSDEQITAIEARPIIGDIVTLEPAATAARAIIHAKYHEYSLAWQLVQRLVAELEESGEAFHLTLLGPEMLRTLANIPAAGGSFRRERDILLGLISKLDVTRKAATETAENRPEGLTAREIEILEHIERGDSNKIIARHFDLSPHTVKRHVANILEKLQVSSRGQASAWYRANLLARE